MAAVFTGVDTLADKVIKQRTHADPFVQTRPGCAIAQNTLCVCGEHCAHSIKRGRLCTGGVCILALCAACVAIYSILCPSHSGALLAYPVPYTQHFEY
jgi:hypothetical protein